LPRSFDPASSRAAGPGRPERSVTGYLATHARVGEVLHRRHAGRLKPRAGVPAACMVDIGGIRVPVIAPEDLVVTKLLAGRSKNLEDARTVLLGQRRRSRLGPSAHRPARDRGSSGLSRPGTAARRSHSGCTSQIVPRQPQLRRAIRCVSRDQGHRRLADDRAVSENTISLCSYGWPLHCVGRLQDERGVHAERQSRRLLPRGVASVTQVLNAHGAYGSSTPSGTVAAYASR
jgi:hypothetical protein